jgi:hypothetical protein
MSEGSERNLRASGEFDVRENEAVPVSTPLDVRP